MFHTCNYTRYAGMQLVSAFKSGMIYLNLKCPISMLWHSTYLHLQIGQIRLTIYTLIRSLCQHRTKVSQSRLEAHFSQAPANASTTSSLCKLNFLGKRFALPPTLPISLFVGGSLSILTVSPEQILPPFSLHLARSHRSKSLAPSANGLGGGRCGRRVERELIPVSKRP